MKVKKEKQFFEFNKTKPYQSLDKKKEKLDEIFRKKNYDINYFKEKFKKKWNEYASKIGMNEEEKKSPNIEDFITYIISVYGVPKEIARNIKINFNGAKRNILDLAKTNSDDKFNEKQFEELVNKIAKFETSYVATGGKYDPEYVKSDENNTSPKSPKEAKKSKKDIIDFISKLNDEKISKLLDIIKKSNI